MCSVGCGNFRGSMQANFHSGKQNFHFGKQNWRAAGALRAISGTPRIINALISDAISRNIRVTFSRVETSTAAHSRFRIFHLFTGCTCHNTSVISVLIRNDFHKRIYLCKLACSGSLEIVSQWQKSLHKHEKMREQLSRILLTFRINTKLFSSFVLDKFYLHLHAVS